MPVPNDRLRRMFESDSKIMLETLRSLVDSIAREGHDPSRVDRAFRAAHSIKSEAGFLELGTVADAAHVLEESLAAVRAGDVDAIGQVAGKAAIAELPQQLDRLVREIEQYRAASASAPGGTGSGEGPAGETLGSAELGMLREARSRNERLFRVMVDLTCDPGLYYPRAFLVINNLELCSGVIQTTPALESLAEAGDGRLTVLLTSSGDEGQLRRALNVDETTVRDISELAYEEVETAPELAAADEETVGPGETSVRVSASRQEEIVLFADELLHLSGELAEAVRSNRTADDSVKGISARLTAYARVLCSRVNSSSRVQLLDSFRELRERSVRYAARHGKRIRFAVSGSGAVVYAPVADTVTDAVLHLIRNSIDHGIETIELRARRGKPPAGVVNVAVDREKDTVRIRVKDDGVGIDEKAVREKSRDGERSLLDILAMPGFTMRGTASTSSGRGVGLDSVAHAVRDLLSGSIELASKPGSGTVVGITIPARNRLIHAIIVDSADGAAAIPASLVVEHRQLNAGRFKRDSLGGHFYDFRGESLPLMTVMGRSPSQEMIGGRSTGVVVRAGDRKLAIVCNEVIAEEAVVLDDSRRHSVYCRHLGRDVPFVFPPAFLLQRE